MEISIIHTSPLSQIAKKRSYTIYPCCSFKTDSLLIEDFNATFMLLAPFKSYFQFLTSNQIQLLKAIAKEEIVSEINRATFIVHSDGDFNYSY